ncbi:unknown protein [Seminavis robusta]|uniref:Jacalin-type lectin domain-containing protein n=1 Tax=Seminavis robusta TaxID=568900 RepID=A0A9N8D8Z6_9STRA|nr:unknown protein [Seminavis robusta]|eukprot:Sro45_g027030.1 n/a (210) ;mRNA; r:96350-96979
MVQDRKVETKTKWTLTKLPAVPSSLFSSLSFDSGCNPSGVKSVQVECGKCFLRGTASYKSTVKRIFLQFHQNVTPETDAIYWGCPVDTENNITFTFEVGPGDEIVKILVWSDGWCIHAVQFHTGAGVVSPRFGIPQEAIVSFASKVTAFEGTPGSRLVGIHGKFGGSIHELGFSFATASNVPCEIGNVASTCDTTDEDSITMVSIGPQG